MSSLKAEHLTFNAYTSNSVAKAPFENRVVVYPGMGNGTADKATNTRKLELYVQGANIGGIPYSLEYTAKHGGMHLLGVPDRYNQPGGPGTVIVPKPGHWDDIMGGVGTQILPSDATQIRSRFHQYMTNANFPIGGYLGRPASSQHQGRYTSDGFGWATYAWSANAFGAPHAHDVDLNGGSIGAMIYRIPRSER